MGLENKVAEAFNKIATQIETGDFADKLKVGVTLLGSELGEEEVLRGAEAAAKDGLFEVVVIGKPIETSLELIEVADEKEMHTKMEELLDSKYLAACVTLHYSFAIGESTIGKVVTPAKGREMYIATTTGTSDTKRTMAMLKNTLYGIAVAKADGIENPAVGIINVDNAKTVERYLKKLAAQGYAINFAESKRSDGGVIMRGNDILMGSVDVMVTDSLTGNIFMKLLSSFTTGGSYEASGSGYGPGVNFESERIINIISRASGAVVIANAIKYAHTLAKGNLPKVLKAEYEKLQAAGYTDILAEIEKKEAPKAVEAPKKEVAKEVVTAEINGIDIMDLEDAVAVLLNAGIYAESGMGCTGPIVLVNDQKLDQAVAKLAEAEFIAQEATGC